MAGFGSTCSSSGHLATTLDREMLEASPCTIFPPHTADLQLPVLNAQEVASQMGQRLLIKYVRPDSVSYFNRTLTSAPADFGGLHWLTLTPYAPDQMISALALPPHRQMPTHALLLNPVEIVQYRELRGPRWVRLGWGIEYLATNGIPSNAIVHPGWPIEVK